MKDRKTILEEFSDMGSKHYFELQNGERYQGWIVEIENDLLEYLDSGPFAAEDCLYVPIGQINLATLAYWDEAKHCWVNAQWNEQEEQWIFEAPCPS